MGSLRRFRWRKRSLWITAIVLAVGGWFSWSYLSLVGAIFLIAMDANPSAPDSLPAVHVENVRWLAKYPPSHIAMLLESPSARLRAVACQVLGSPEMVDADGDWKEVPTALANVAAYDNDRRVRQLALNALRSGKDLTAEDLQQLQLIAGPELPFERRQRLVESIAFRCDKVRPEFAVWMDELAASPLVQDQMLALSYFAEHDPQRESLPRLFRNVINDSIATQPGFVNHTLRSLCRVRPQFATELLQGSDEEAALVLALLAEVRRERLARRAPAITGFSNSESLFRRPRIPVDELLEDEQLEALAKARAEASITSDHRELRLAGIEYLGRDPDGAHALLAACRTGTLPLIAETLATIERLVWSVMRKPECHFRFDREEADYLVSLLNDPDLQVRQATASILHAGLAEDMETFNPFAPGQGPLNPEHVQLFARILDSDEQHLWWLSLEYFNRVVPFDERQIERVAQAIRQTLGGTPQTHRAFVQLADRFPDRRQTKELAYTLLNESPHPTPALISAAKYLFDDSPQHIFSHVVHLYQTCEVTHQDCMLALIIDFSRQLGGFNNPSFAMDIWQSYLAWCIRDPSACQTVNLREMQALVGPEVAQIGLEQALFHAIRQRQRGLANLSQLPGFTGALTRAVEQSLEDAEPLARLGAVEAIEETNLSAERKRELLRRSMQDEDPRVAIAAVEKTMEQKLATPQTMGDLRELAMTAHNAALRSVALENITSQLPRDDQTIRLVDALLADPDFQVRLTARHASRLLARNRDMVVD